ncbi:spore germination protein [Desulforamulus reducens MI-1]|uniref:Spore germination protein n=1 Tax=Desulforamulus reducens (strain ATCC BAA-1160 / DSM 100696 / MI-1) TaxID=349161 RepID=A4J7W7_DESRM|nr:endospore germination permease [Desulforamulus reducens]ABO51170.1 spore germination protein [Desulforamulus reducens MI-1]
MKNYSNVMTSKQLLFTVVSITIGVGILTLPEAVGKSAQQDAWISLLIGGSLPLAGIFLVNLIGSRFPDLTLAEYAEKILGKWLGKLLSLIFVFYGLVYAAIITRLFVGMLKNYLFPVTPVWVLGALVFSLIAYLVSKDARVLGRVNELMFYEALVLYVALLLAIPNFDYNFIRPVGHAGMMNILKGTSETFLALLGVEFLMVFYPMVQNKKEFVKASVTGLVIVMFIYLTLVLVVLGVFGPVIIGQLRFALMVLLKTYTAPLIERAEFFFVIFYVFIAFRPIGNMYFASRYTAERIFGVNAPGLMTVILLPLVFTFFLFPKNFEQTVAISTMIGYGGIGFLIVMPLILWLIAVIRGIGSKKE